MTRIIVRTNFTNTVTKVHEFLLEDLREPQKLDLLRQVFQGSEKLKPVISPQELTAKAVERFAELGQRLQNRRTPDDQPLHDPRAIAHFLNQLVFCMFAEDARLLPDGLFTKTLKGVQTRPERARQALSDLFKAMASEGEDDRYLLGVGVIEWFNGGLFDGAEPLLLEPADLKLIADTAGEHDWSEIDPAIFGTMFEEALKATRKRAALGAHYTDREKILKIVDPVIVRPLTAEWAAARADIEAAAQDARAAEARRKAVFDEATEALKAGQGKADETKRRKAVTAAEKERTLAQNAARDRLEAFLKRLAAYRVLDPACGSGNFLYVALHALKDLELTALIEAERLTGLQSPAPRVGLQCVRGIEIEPYAAELARVTLWIGDLQWSLKNGYRNWPRPILSKLDQIENRDALLNPDGTEAEWPEVDAIVGNPPFLGAKLMRRKLGSELTETIRQVYSSLPGFTDFVCYWFEKARVIISERPSVRAGFVATNSIRKNTNLPVLKKITASARIFDAWSEEKWTLDGAAVDVSLACFGVTAEPAHLDGSSVSGINADLTTGLDLTLAVSLSENRDGAYLGIQKSGPFDVSGVIARRWIALPANPNGRLNSEVLRPYWNGDDLTGRPRDGWFIDLPMGLTAEKASQFQEPYQHLAVTPDDDGKLLSDLRKALGERAGPRWWEPHWPRPEMRSRIRGLGRYLATPETAVYRLFVWIPEAILPDKNLIVIPRNDDVSFGLLQSRHHEVWSLRKGSDLQDRPRYTHTTVFATFPFPEGLTPNILAADYADDPRAVAIAEAARELNALRENWLNPPGLVRIEAEVVPGYPDRVLPKDEEAAKVLKTRTLTNLYNQRPAWLDMAHKRLDAAVAAAYGWPDYLSDDEVLERLFHLNQERAAAGR
ncbi:MAG: class I SAM-dependent DNA methyltransferase [Pseudomonadota bacterium]